MGNYRRQGRPQSKWLTLRYGAPCKVCQADVPAGEIAFWDAGAKTVTCHNLACCEADGLTSREWRGSPVSGSFVAVRAERRIGASFMPASKGV